MAKVVSKSSPTFASGGDAGKFNPTPGSTSKQATPGKEAPPTGTDGSRFGSGGPPGGFNPPGASSAGPAKAGTANTRTGDGGKFAAGGGHSMMSNRGAVPQRPGKTSSY